jgi:hypothetical protein
MANIVEIIKTFKVQLALKNIYSKIDEIIRKLNDSEPKYKVYTALLTQTGIDAPVATVLENTLELNPTYYYDGVGAYRIEDAQGLFTTDKTFVSSTGTGGSGISININDATTIEIGCTQDDILVNAAFEIRVYN